MGVCLCVGVCVQVRDRGRVYENCPWKGKLRLKLIKSIGKRVNRCIVSLHPINATGVLKIPFIFTILSIRCPYSSLKYNCGVNRNISALFLNGTADYNWFTFVSSTKIASQFFISLFFWYHCFLIRYYLIFCNFYTWLLVIHRAAEYIISICKNERRTEYLMANILRPRPSAFSWLVKQTNYFIRRWTTRG